MRRFGGLLVLLTGCELIGDVSDFHSAEPIAASSSSSDAASSTASSGSSSSASSGAGGMGGMLASGGMGGSAGEPGVGGDGGVPPGDPCALLAGANLLPNGDVEDGVGTGQGAGFEWEPYDANVSAVTSPVQEGSQALSVCAASGEDTYSTFIDVFTATSAEYGHSYSASACFHEKTGSNPPSSLALTLRVRNPDPPIDVDSPDIAGLGPAWEGLVASGAIPDANHRLLVLIIEATGSNSCFVVDRAVVAEDP